ncbi:MAG: tyrosine-type recombinase/integrase [Clostridium sp.]|uniref:tyrosine-type recombinase/integrase n=1 Tax=Clostridium sp. TaxID=1506 RepID=UPI0039E7D6F3
MKRKKLELNRVKEGKTFQKGFEEFILYCKARNLRETTIKHYRDIEHIWYLFIPPDTQLSSITSKTVEEFIRHLRNNTKSNEVTVNSTLITIRAVLYYFMKLEYVERFKIPKLKYDKKVIEVYTDAELELLLQKPDLKSCNFLEYRTWCIVNFLLATGCRARTLVNIRLNDLDFQNDLVKYTWTKNRKEQLVPMSSTIKKILIEYLQYRQGEPEDFLFVNAYGNFLQVDLLSHNIIDYNARRGVMKRGVHRFRHSFAKKWILAGGDIFRLQKILGHSSMDIVRNYVEMFTSDLQKDFDQYNPLEQMKPESKQSITMKRNKRK